VTNRCGASSRVINRLSSLPPSLIAKSMPSMLSHSQTPRGRLRLELPVSFGRLHVLPIVSQFMSKWPEISVNVSFNDRFVDLIDKLLASATCTKALMSLIRSMVIGPTLPLPLFRSAVFGQATADSRRLGVDWGEKFPSDGKTQMIVGLLGWA
jgi:hypothetical protein